MAVTFREMKRGAKRIAALEFLEALRTGELIASASAVTIDGKPTGADDLTLSAVTVLAASMEINGNTVLTGQGITFSVQAAADQALGQYTLHGTVTTDSVPAEVIPYCVRVMVRDC